MRLIGKMKKMIALIVSLFTIGLAAFPQDSLLNIVKEELVREFEAYKDKVDNAFYLEYRIDDVYSVDLQSVSGSLVHANEDRDRMLTASFKLGGYSLDFSVDKSDDFQIKEMDKVFSTSLPIEDEPDAIKQIIWRATHNVYKNAYNMFSHVKNSLASKENSDSINYFSKEEPTIYFTEQNQGQIKTIDLDLWKERIKKYSMPFQLEDSIVMGNSSFNYMKIRKYFITSEGTEIIQDFDYTQLHIIGSILTKEGNVLPLMKSYYSFLPDSLPHEDVIISDINQLISKLKELQNAKTADPYSGPAILSAKAAGVFFHEIFGHRVEGHRLDDRFDAHTFKDKINQKVLPKTISIDFDPTTKNYGNKNLFGWYKFDDQGIKAQKTNVIDQGVLTNFLMSRSPNELFGHSNGHGRASIGNYPVSRQSNMFVTCSKPVDEKELRKLLIKECKKQNKDYGYYFKEVIGGFTMTGRYMPNVFNVIPTEVYRIYADGRPDELMRGVDLIGTPLIMFSGISQAGDKPDVFSGFCGAESGFVPVSTVCPSILVKRIETQLKTDMFVKLPILPKPALDE